MPETDAVDLRILALLQQDSRITQAEIAAAVRASQTACWRRIRSLEAAGYIRRQVALLDADKVGLPVNVMSQVRLVNHSDEARATFERFVAGRPEILECYAMSGEWDYTLRVVVRDVSAYEHFLMAQLLHNPVVASANSNFALRQVKYETALPLAPP